MDAVIGIESLDKLFAAIDAGTPIHEFMRDNERAAGRTVVVPGSVPWLSADDWDPTVVVSREGNRVRLVAILALNPGRGALKRTVAGIQEVGLEPCIVEPTRELQETLRRWGWRSRRVGSGMESETIWYPRRRAARARPAA